MQSLLALPFELQIVLLVGYLGYKVSTIGRSVSHRTEDFLLQVLTFGSIGRIAAAGLLQLVSLWRGSDATPLTENLQLVIVASASLIVTLAVSLAWRLGLQTAWVKFMALIGAYRDDHQSSVWASILETKALWHCVLIHCEDGKVYESDFRRIPDGIPLARICLNDDGISTYVTRVYRADDSAIEVTPSTEEYGSTINYFPRANIKRIEIAWEKS